MKRAICPDADRHTPCALDPSDYRGWHAWAEHMSKTHRQVRCPGCGLFTVWIPKTKTKRKTP